MFTTTHWSVVLAAGDAASPHAAQALEKLCQTYWYPLYAYVRRRGYSPHDAQDLTQGFFAHLLGRNFLDYVSPQRGKFRSFLLASLNHFMSNERERAGALKRGGGQTLISIDADVAEDQYRLEPADAVTAEHIFERRWALTVLEQSFQELRDEFAAADKLAQFDRLKTFLEGEVHPGDYNRAAPELGMTPAGVATAVHRLRQRYAEIVRCEVAQTVADPAQVEEEMGNLRAILSR